jgi:hypothetical protein
MISEVPHLSQDFCELLGAGSIISFPSSRFYLDGFRSKWGGFSMEVGRGYDASGAPFRTKWGTRKWGAPVAKQIRAFLAAMVL